MIYLPNGRDPLDVEELFPAPLWEMFSVEGYTAKRMEAQFMTPPAGQDDFLPLPLTEVGLNCFLTEEEIYQHDIVWKALIAKARGSWEYNVAVEVQRPLLSLWWSRFSECFQRATGIPKRRVIAEPYRVFSLPSYLYSKELIPTRQIKFPAAYAYDSANVGWSEARDYTDKQALEIFLGKTPSHHVGVPEECSVQPWDVFSTDRLTFQKFNKELPSVMNMYLDGTFYQGVVSVREIKDGVPWIGTGGLAAILKDVRPPLRLKARPWNALRKGGMVNLYEVLSLLVSNPESYRPKRSPFYAVPPRFGVHDRPMDLGRYAKPRLHKPTQKEIKQRLKAEKTRRTRALYRAMLRGVGGIEDVEGVAEQLVDLVMKPASSPEIVEIVLTPFKRLRVDTTQGDALSCPVTYTNTVARTEKDKAFKDRPLWVRVLSPLVFLAARGGAIF